VSPSPEAHYAHKESISLAFVTALQTLPPRQVAVLILRDVLDFRAAEVAEMLDTSLDSVNSALKRARAALRQREPSRSGAADPVPGTDASAAQEAAVARFVRAYEAGDVNALIDLLTDDVFVSMPPVPLEYHGREAVTRFYQEIIQPGRGSDLVPTRANGQPAFGIYIQAQSGIRHGAGLLVLTLTGDTIGAYTRFDSSVLAWFGLPRSLPTR
jgi:RNA polymerase sigma-70 factor (ECF subfamily)